MGPGLSRWRSCWEGFLDVGSEGFQSVASLRRPSLSPPLPIPQPKTTNPSNILQALTFGYEPHQNEHTTMPTKDTTKTNLGADVTTSNPLPQPHDTRREDHITPPSPTLEDNLALLSAHDQKTLKGKNPQTCSEPYTSRTKRTHALSAGKSIHAFITYWEPHPRTDLQRVL